MANITSTLSRRGLLSAGAGIPFLASFPFGLVDEARADVQPAAGNEPHGNGYYRFNIGEFKATVVSDGYGSFAFWPTLAANQEKSVVEAFMRENHAGLEPQLTNNLLVVDTPADRVLVDTGFGDAIGPQSGHFPLLLQNLKRAGIAPDSITAVIITHCHLDHIAGIVNKAGEHLFPKARFIIVDDELTYWTGDRWEADINASALPDGFKQGAIYAVKTYLPPISKRMEVVKPGAEVLPGISLIPAPGHSPAHTAIRFSSGKEQLIHMADVVHNPISGPQHPEWSVIFDYDGEQALKTRKAILGQAAADRIMVMGYHFPFPALGYVETAGSAYRFSPVQWTW